MKTNNRNHIAAVLAIMVVLASASDMCDMNKMQHEADEITSALKATSQRASNLYTEDSDIQYFSDLSLDTGEHDHGSKRRDEKFANNAEGFMEEQQLRFLRQERERLADQRDLERKQRLVLHMHHLQQNKYHVPRLLRKNKKGNKISDEAAFQKRGGLWRFVRLAFSNWPSFIGFILVGIFDILAFAAAFIIPYMMIQRLKRPGLMAGTGVRTPPRPRSN